MSNAVQKADVTLWAVTRGSCFSRSDLLSEQQSENGERDAVHKNLVTKSLTGFAFSD